MGSKKLTEIAEAYGATFIHRPFDWRLVIEVGGPGPLNGVTDERRFYFSGREVMRWAEYYGQPVM